MRRLLPLLALAALAPAACAASTIDPAAAFAWGANIGWVNWRPSAADGIVTGEYVCSGYVWAANAGWINLGSGTPANGIRYQNTDGADSGVNLLADGSLRGLAWGANIGWVNFEATGNPRINLTTGTISGYAWGANVGWITLGTGSGQPLATKSIPQGADTDGDGITDAWELEHAGNLTTFTATGDADGDGIPDIAEYAAGTDPLDATDFLRIVSFAIADSGVTTDIVWTSHPTRRYRIETTLDLTAGWAIAVPDIVPDPGSTTARTLADTAVAQRFYRVIAKRPLAP